MYFCISINSISLVKLLKRYKSKFIGKLEIIKAVMRMPSICLILHNVKNNIQFKESIINKNKHS